MREEEVPLPGSVAHMLIFEDVVSGFEKDNEYDDDFVRMLKENINYGRLGSLGPDLPTYEGVLRTAYSFLTSGYNEPAPLEKWSGQLHNKSPNVFPLKMIEIAWRETDLDEPEWDAIAKKQWAFIIGFLTHMAADQMIHPYINKIAGQYYRLKENRLKHMECEVYQDVVVFNNKFRKSILGEKLENWMDIRAESGKTEPYFRIFLQKSFIEAHAIYPSDAEIESWVRGLLFVYKYVKWIGLPFKNADNDFQKNKENSVKYKEYWLSTSLTKNKSYEDYYKNAVELATIYAQAAYHLYEINHIDFKDKHRSQFLKIVINADLSNPLDNEILEDAKKAYSEFYGR
ncbi:MAG: zinc dependent phospholipase C family protein [Methanomicrobiales archaeon]|nr:zinc dependent phospholipase C family protein [Methanomicrobiales archaeon]